MLYKKVHLLYYFDKFAIFVEQTRKTVVHAMWTGLYVAERVKKDACVVWFCGFCIVILFRCGNLPTADKIYDQPFIFKFPLLSIYVVCLRSDTPKPDG